jgi:hypothetical protein
VSGVVTTFDDEDGQAIHVTAGWDNITGLGVPNGKKFINALK